MITIKQKGNFKKLDNYLERIKDVFDVSILDKYGKAGVEALRVYTPKDTGLTADSWRYNIVRDTKNGRLTVEFHNVNIQNGIRIALILQYGHATRTGGWVEGRNYIQPALQNIFENLAKEAWEEVRRV